MGSSALFSSLYLLSCDEESNDLAESVFQAYIDKNLGGGAEIRLAPSVISQAHGYRIALLLVYKGNDTANVFFRNGAVSSKIEPAPPLQKGFHQHHRTSPNNENRTGPEHHDTGGRNEDDDVSHMTGDDDLLSRGSDDDDDGDDGEDDQFHMDEEAVTQLTKKCNELEAEKEKALILNMELQKKCSSILARIGRDIQSRNGPPGGGDPGQENDGMNNPNNNSLDSNAAEKENHFYETLSSISDGRSKLLKQQTEYEQMAYDLQSRLDEKEYKAEEISESLNEFKREILTKAENSRTAQGLSKKLIKQFEFNEKKKDNELEKVILPISCSSHPPSLFPSLLGATPQYFFEDDIKKT